MSEVAPFVYYRPEDYAPTARRIPSFLIDVVVLLATIAAPASLVQVLIVPATVQKMPNSPEKAKNVAKYTQSLKVPVAFIGVLFMALYHIALRRTAGGTIGYRLTGIRMVEGTGGIPTWTTLLKRFGLAMLILLGCTFLAAIPARLLINAYPKAGNAAGLFAILLFIGAYPLSRNDRRRQTFYDRWSGTWLIRKRAQPAGPAKPAYQAKLLGTFLFTYLDIEPADDQSRDRERAPDNAEL